MDQVAAAIQTQEGYYPGTVAYKNNNPGNLGPTPWTQSQPGYAGVGAGGFAMFDSPASGTAAMDALIQNYSNRGYTVQQMLNAWAPACADGSTPMGGVCANGAAQVNNPTLYAQNVAAAAGVTPDTLLSQVLVSDGSGGYVAVDSGTPVDPNAPIDLGASSTGFTIDPLVLGLGLAAGALLLLQV